jgi:FAD/FMN-containing dehydrogenase
MRRLLSITLGLSVVLAGAGCGGTDDGTPVACLNGSAAYLRALEAAPDEVRLAGEVPISECLAENQQVGHLAGVGGALLKATTELNAEARAQPGGAANVRLGYLIGAAQAGAEGTDGIHAELMRRLIAAATYSPGKQVLTKEFERAYREGFDAGLARG